MMVFRSIYMWLLIGLISVVAYGCGDDCEACDECAADDDNYDAGTSDEEDAQVETDAEVGDLTDAEIGSGPNMGDFLPDAVCGNGKVEGMEVCDDANLDSRDGCNNLCEYSCEVDDDCDDMNDCNGTEICVEHACDDTAEDLPDGAMCDDDDTKSCRLGICVSNICGDGKTTSDEDCDDGNLDPNDGCTPDCTYTCEEDSDCTSGDVCLGARVCNTDEHICEGGRPLDDQTECELQDPATIGLCGESGWCMKGVCVCEKCGNEIVEDDEDCDDGEDNGTDKSECSINCRVVKCGDGKVQGNEECDDGNVKRLDGCDTMCEYELAHRFTSMEIKRGEPPSWCYYSPSNRFAEAFADEIRVMGVMPLDILSMVNDTLSGGMVDGEDNIIFHFLDSDDTTMRTADEDISIAVYQAHTGPGEWTQDQPVDFPMYIKRDQVNSDGTPTDYHKISVEQLGAGQVVSSDPETIEMLGLRGMYRVFNFKIQLVFDYESLSKPDVPTFEDSEFDDTIAWDVKQMALNDHLKLPSESGVTPPGIWCGAIGADAVADPVTMVDMTEGMSPTAMMEDPMGMMANMCCKNAGNGPTNDPQYTGCGPTDTPGVDCDTQATIIRYGCTVCLNRDDFDMENPSQFGSDCSLMDSDPSSCFTVIQGIEFDVDTDDDGENDSWSALFEFSARRARLYGVSQ